jgi:hypothetical protein
VTEVFICTTAVYTKLGDAVTCHRDYAGSPGFEGFEVCGFETRDFDEAMKHVLDRDHRVVSREHGDSNKPMLREMHGADPGGVYLHDYREASDA